MNYLNVKILNKNPNKSEHSVSCLFFEVNIFLQKQSFAKFVKTKNEKNNYISSDAVFYLFNSI